MSLLCSIAGHSAQTTYYRNQGFDFSICHHCGRDLIRTAHGEWTPVPRGMRVVWREGTGFGEAGSVADRRPRRRSESRYARPARRRDRRARPLNGAAAMLGILVNLSSLVRSDVLEDVQDAPSRTGPKAIHLPGALY